MSLNSGHTSALALIITSIVSILLTLGVVGIIISKYGVEKVATEVSPFVENTLETVLPAQEVVEPETEADVIMDSVAQNQGSSVLIYEGSEFLGRGIMVSSNGFVVTDASLIKASTSYSVAVPGTKERLAATIFRTEDGLAVLKITISTTLVASFGNNFPVSNDLVVAITGDEKMSIGTGIVTKTTIESIVTNIYGNITPGSPLVAKNGNVIGISLVGEQKAGEAIFKTLTKDDIYSLTKPVDGNLDETVLD
jgi:hypothetical protein